MLYCMGYITTSRTYDLWPWSNVKQFYSITDFNTSYKGSIYIFDINNLSLVNTIHEDAGHTDNKNNTSEIDKSLEIYVKESTEQVKNADWELLAVIGKIM